MATWTAALESAPWLRTPADFALVEMWGSLHDEKRMLSDVLAADGPLTTGSTGQMAAHPALAALRAVEDRILKLASTPGAWTGRQRAPRRVSQGAAAARAAGAGGATDR